MAYRWTLTNNDLSTSQVLTIDPLDWNESVYKIARSNRYNGVFHEYSTKMKFVCNGGGKEFIDTAYDNLGVDASVSVLVEYECGDNIYSELWSGVLNFKDIVKADTTTTINIGNTDLLTKLMNRNDIPVNIESSTSIGGETITPVSTETITLDGMDIYLENEYQTPHETYEDLPFFVGYIYQSPNVFYYIDGTTGNPLSTTKTRYRPKFNMVKSSLGGAPVIIDDVLNDDDTEIEEIYHYIEQELITDSPIDVNYSIVFDGLFRERDGDSTCNDTHVHTHNYKLIIAYGQDWGSRTEVTVYDFDSTPGDDDVWTRDKGTNHDETISINETGQITLVNGDKVWLYFYHEAEGYADVTSPCLLGVPFFITSEYAYQFEDTCLVTLDVTTTFEDTECKTVLVHEALTAVVDSIADSDNNIYSDFYGRDDSQKVTYAEDGEGSLLALSNGYNIREINKGIFFTFDELFDSLNAINNIGVGELNSKIRIEPIEFFFSNTEILELQNVPNFTVKPYANGLFNKLTFGFMKWETEVRGGLDEPCTSHTYSTNSIFSGQYSRVSKYIGSSYGIELTRRKSAKSNSETEDWRYDNDNFFICVIRSPYASGAFLPEKFHNAFSGGSNMAALTTAFNLRITPKRMLLSHLNMVTPSLQKLQSEVTFVNGQGNILLETEKNDSGFQSDYSGVSVAENSDIAWNDANAENISPLFLPEIYSFEYPLTFNQFITIKNNPYGYISFYKFSDDVKSGYIMNMEYSMKTGLTKFELIRRA